VFSALIERSLGQVSRSQLLLVQVFFREFYKLVTNTVLLSLAPFTMLNFRGQSSDHLLLTLQNFSFVFASIAHGVESSRLELELITE
jgi:hypothetical protein